MESSCEEENFLKGLMKHQMGALFPQQLQASAPLVAGGGVAQNSAGYTLFQGGQQRKNNSFLPLSSFRFSSFQSVSGLLLTLEFHISVNMPFYITFIPFFSAF